MRDAITAHWQNHIGGRWVDGGETPFGGFGLRRRAAR